MENPMGLQEIRDKMNGGVGEIDEPDLSHHYTFDEVDQIAKDLRSRVKCSPTLGVICGSGLGGLADIVDNKEIIEYTEIPGFPVSTVPGHAGRLVFGILEGQNVVIMQGRVHLYEGYNVQKITMPVRVMKLLGVKTLIVTNAAGGLRDEFNVGDIMIIKDHLNLPGFAGVNPLVGPNDDRFGVRFPAQSQAYDKGLRDLAKKVVKELGYGDFVHEGVYSMLGGPSFETVTECKFLQLAGVDATGMSTVPEVIVATHCGMKVLGLSLITNKCIMEYDSNKFANHEEVLETGRKRAKDMQTIVTKIIRGIDT